MPSAAQTERNRKGGQATSDKYDHDHYVSIGKLGGRPTFHEGVRRANEREEARRRRLKRRNARVTLRTGPVPSKQEEG